MPSSREAVANMLGLPVHHPAELSMLKLATKFIPEATFFANAVQAGFEYAEFWTSAQILTEWKNISALSRQYPLNCALHFPNKGDLSEETLGDAVQLYRALGCPAMVIHRPMYRRYGAKLLEIDPTLRMGVENHRLSRTLFDAWASEHQWLTLDVEHLWKYTLGDAPLDELLQVVREFFVRSADKVIHVHMPGYLPGYDEHRPMYCNRDLAIGVFDILAEFSFEGLIVSETKAEFQNFHELRMDRLLFERWQETASRHHTDQKQGLVSVDATPAGEASDGQTSAV